MKTQLLGLYLSGIFILTACGAAVAGDAVTEGNGKVDLFGGRVDGKDSGNISASYAFPLNGCLGAQVDSLYGRLNDEDLYAGGAHVFWRDPEQALLGLNASYGQWNSFDIWRMGVEAEIYLKNITLAGAVGEQSDDLNDTAYADARLQYYTLGENLMLACGGATLDDQTLLTGSVEYQTRLNGLGLFAFGAIGSDDYDLAIGGIRYYFGPAKPLMRRHREDDPFNYLFDAFSRTITPSYSSFSYGFGNPDAIPE